MYLRVLIFLSLTLIISTGCTSIETDPAITQSVNTDVISHTLTLNDVKFDKKSGTIIGYVAHYKAITIPKRLDNTSVTHIGYSAFECKNLTDVIIPNTITSIASYAFFGNSLTRVVIPNSVTTLGDFSFNSNQLTTVTLPDAITSIGEFSFDQNKLIGVTLQHPCLTCILVCAN